MKGGPGTPARISIVAIQSLVDIPNERMLREGTSKCGSNCGNGAVGQGVEMAKRLWGAGLVLSAVLLCASPVLARHCSKGTPCGNSCIAAGKTCHAGRGHKKGKVHRSKAAVATFKRTHECPTTHQVGGPCPGYEVDHIVPLACGGADDPSNMQWLTEEENRHKGSMGCRLR